MNVLFKNIKELIQVRETAIDFLSGKEMNVLPTITNAFLLIKDGLISDFGLMENCPDIEIKTIDATGKMILPSWCDSHTHIVFAGNRETEFVDRINGLSYKEIADNGGGILNSAKKLQETSFEDLLNQANDRLKKVIESGTGAIEIKSGYGLTLESELKILRVIKELKNSSPVTIKATLLAAHALPLEFKGRKDEYLDLIIDKLLPIVEQEGLADYIDIFCEEGYFSVSDLNRLLIAGKKHGLQAKTHVNQFTTLGGVKASVENGALSVDHLEIMSDQDMESLQGSSCMATFLPSCSFFLGIPYGPARELINKGLPLALASDYNPGSSPNWNMNLVTSLACIKMNLTPEEAINASTINSAYAMGISDKLGSIAIGKKANLFITKPMPSYGFMQYSFGENNIENIILNGKILNPNNE